MTVAPVRSYSSVTMPARPAGAKLTRRGPGWLLYYVAGEQLTYLYARTRSGWLVQVYRGKAIPPCCR